MMIRDSAPVPGRVSQEWIKKITESQASEKAWREMYETVENDAPERGEFRGVPVANLIETPSFKSVLARELKEQVEQVRVPESSSAMMVNQTAITGFRAAQDFGLLSPEVFSELNERVHDSDFADSLFTEINALLKQAGEREQHYANYIAITYASLIKMHLIDEHEEDIRRISARLMQEKFKKSLVKGILTYAASGEEDGVSAADAMMGFEAGMELKLISSEDQKKIETIIHTDAFQRSLAQEILQSAERGQQEKYYAMRAATLLGALKRMSPNHEEVN